MKEVKENEFVEVKTSGIHNKGVFAKKDIKKGTRIIEYVGEIITKEESDMRADKVLNDSKENPEKGSVYIFTLNKKFDIDGNVEWNPARYINHACSTNCEAVNDEDHIWIEATKDIKEGEELLYNYGYNIDNYEDHPCRCGKPNCIGYIADKDLWAKLKRKIKKKKFKEKRV